MLINSKNKLAIYPILLVFIIVLCFSQDITSNSIDPEVYVFNRFVFPLSLLVIVFSTPKILFRNEILRIILIFISFAFVGLSSPFVKNDILLWKLYNYVSPLVSSYVLYSIINNSSKSKSVIILISCASIFAILRKFNDPVDFISYFNFQNYLTGYNLKFESDLYSTIFGLTFLYFVFERDFKSAFFLFLFIILTAKRIVLFGAIFSIGLYFLVSAQAISKFRYFIILLNFIFIVSSYLLAIEFEFFSIYLDFFFRKSINEINNGRNAIYSDVLEILKFPDIVGHGIGIVNSILKMKNSADLFHSDTLRLAYELGIIPFLYLLKNLLDLAKRSSMQVVLVFFVSVVFTTDNIVEYFPVMFSFYFIFFTLSSNYSNN